MEPALKELRIDCGPTPIMPARKVGRRATFVVASSALNSLVLLAHSRILAARKEDHD
jgi:hypothetical protein